MNIELIEKRFPPVEASRTFNRILDTLSLRNKKVLDLGCGYGEYLVKFGKESLGITSTVDEVEYGKMWKRVKRRQPEIGAAINSLQWT